MAQFGRPISDISFTMDAGTPDDTDRFNNIDEISADGYSEYIYEDNNVNGGAEFLLTSLTDPASSTGHTIRLEAIQMDSDGAGRTTEDTGGTAVSLQLDLVEGATVRATRTLDLSASDGVGYSSALSAAEADAIADYTDLRIRFSLSGGGGGPNDRRGCSIDWVELEVPDAGGTDFIKFANDTLELSESPRLTASLVRRVAETIEVAELLRPVLSLVRVLGSVISIGATVGKATLATYTGGTGEIQIGDSQQRLRTILLRIAETVQITEAARVVQALVRRVAETVNIVEVTRRARSLVRLLTETVNIGETIVDVLTGVGESLVQVVNETVEIVEQVLHPLSLVRRLAETVQISESSRAVFALVRRLAETVEISEASRAAQNLIRQVAEVVQIGEAARQVRALVRLVAETVNIGEAIARAGIAGVQFIRIVNETVEIAEARLVALWPTLHNAAATLSRQFTAVTVVGRSYTAIVTRQAVSATVGARGYVANVARQIFGVSKND